ncbi:hypothetical protein SAMN05444336_112117 [Albimonas donghaensis]|uniref:Uncharacterized protein n=1 Tax=Albimonas donghaensis TaxID=356660 RepID=A0A1H3FJL4_9RHOB|nr:DUF6441 family protein [Albimonas donghaensis]SDX90334.1 hypothetical protein SAMN05444336_112117 [Albimonas donghaensis]
MKLDFSVTGLAQAMQEEIAGGRRAVSASMKEVGDGLKMEWRGQVTSAGLGRRLSNTVRSETFPKGRDSINAATLVWSKAPKILEAYEEGALIQSDSGFFLAVPTAAAGTASRGRKVTPGDWESRRGLKLRFVYRKGQPSLLVVDAARINARGLAVASRSKTGRGQVTAVIFLLIPQVQLAKKLDLARAAQTWEGRLPGRIVRNWASGRIGGGR